MERQDGTEHDQQVAVHFTQKQFDLLQRYAQEVNVPIGPLVRETVQKALIAKLEQRQKQQALEWMASLHLPTADWDEIEAELESRWSACDACGHLPTFQSSSFPSTIERNKHP